jgi:hypothetical protein
MRGSVRAAAVARFWVAAALLIASAGCHSAASRPDLSQLTQSERLQRQYLDLASGRFAVIADFEEEAHTGLFHAQAAPPDQRGFTIDPSAGVANTGGHSLRMVFPNSATQLVADGSSAEAWALMRDWRPYELLLMSVNSPIGDVQLDIAVVAGRGDYRVEAHSLVPLQAGWNLVRLDLSEAADLLPLDDVQQLRWSIAGHDGPVELIFDDLLLADNRREFFGTDSGARGSLYVVQEGRRIAVGAAGRFELSFSNGQIVKWFALDRDTSRREDLVGSGNTLGPIPLVLASDSLREAGSDNQADMQSFSALGKVIAARQTVLQANDVFVQVECEWAFGESSSEVSAGSPRQRWLYTIYPTGQIYVTIETTTQHAAFRADHLGLAVSRRILAGMGAGAHEPAGLDERAELRHVCYGWIGGESQAASLLFVMRDSRSAPRMEVVEMTEAHRVTLVAFGGEPEFPMQRWHALLCVWPPAVASAAMREDVALAYAAPAPSRLLTGKPAGDEASDAPTINAELGTIDVVPDNSVVKLVLPGEVVQGLGQPIRVQGIGESEAWVYINDRLHKAVARTPDGALVFQVPPTPGAEVRVDVHLHK